MSRSMCSPRRNEALLLALALTSGCALTPEVIRLTPEVPRTPVAGAERVELRVVVDDLRPERTDVVARKVNGFGMQLAEITSETPLAEVLARAVTGALVAQGYRVGESGRVTLVVELLVFRHEFRTGFWAGRSEAEVMVLATLRDASRRELFREVLAETFAHPIQVASGANVKKAYEHALTATLERLLSSDVFRQALVPAVDVPSL